MKEHEKDFFRPMWRRVAITVFLVGWLGFELLYSHDQMWALIVGCALAYAVWSFFISFDRRDGDKGNGPAA